jgi:Domain of unknown function (DUF4402)
MYWICKTAVPLLAALALDAGVCRAQQAAECAGCALSATQAQPRRPLSVEIEGPLSFSKVIGSNTQDGSVSVDPRTGERNISGGLRDAGGLSLQGRARVRGEPYSLIIISFPNRIEMRSVSGKSAQLVDFQSSLVGVPMLDANGELNFSFGARLIVKGRISGQFRASIPISADYP